MQLLRATAFIAGLACLVLIWLPGTAAAADVDELLRLGDRQGGEPTADVEPLMAYA